MRADRASRDESTTEPVWTTALRALVHVAAAAAFVGPTATVSGTVASSVGALAGVLVARKLASGPLRLPIVLALAATGLALAAGLHGVLSDAAWLARLTGPALALRIAEASLLLPATTAVCAALRVSSARVPVVGVIETVALVGATSSLLAAHRGGAIHRPFAIADPIRTAGGDPTFAIVLIGAIAVALSVLALVTEQRAGRALLHLGAIGALLASIVGTTRLLGPPSPPPSGEGLGLRGQGRESDAREGSDADREREQEDLAFRDEYRNEGAQAPVAVVLFHDEYEPPSGIYYFRQGAFSEYNGVRLVRTSRADVDQDVASGFPVRPYELRAAPASGAWRAQVRTTVGLLADHLRPFGLEAPVRLEPARNPDPRRFERVYRVHSAALLADATALLDAPAGSSDWSDAIRRYYLEGPADPRYRELAERIVREKLPASLRDRPFARAVAITSYLSEHGTYSLRSRHAGAPDPTAHFLFGDLTGYCVHFAHAAVFLMRSLGIPARVATGYAVAEEVRAGGSAVLLRGRDSHAWPEVHFEGAGWVVLDVQPRTALDGGAAPPDPELQRMLADLLRDERPLPPDPTWPAIARRLRRSAGGIARATTAAVALALVAMALVKAWRRLAPHWCAPASRPRLVYRAALDALSDVGWRRVPGETREAFAQRLATQLPALVALTRVHLAAAFGSRVAPNDPRTLWRALRAQLRAAVPWWRRWLGTLLPWTFLRTR
ncbi:MAG: transglutaminase domain-containing protein [Myxococcales bacterium]|nr:transglutaminase domain-containing protein [Myxococcales bacterium]